MINDWDTFRKVLASAILRRIGLRKGIIGQSRKVQTGNYRNDNPYSPRKKSLKRVFNFEAVTNPLLITKRAAKNLDIGVAEVMGSFRASRY